MLDTLKINGEFDHFKLGNGGKMMVEGIGSCVSAMFFCAFSGCFVGCLVLVVC